MDALEWLVGLLHEAPDRMPADFPWQPWPSDLGSERPGPVAEAAAAAGCVRLSSHLRCFLLCALSLHLCCFLVVWPELTFLRCFQVVATASRVVMGKCVGA